MRFIDICPKNHKNDITDIHFHGFSDLNFSRTFSRTLAEANFSINFNYDNNSLKVTHAQLCNEKKKTLSLRIVSYNNSLIECTLVQHTFHAWLRKENCLLQSNEITRNELLFSRHKVSNYPIFSLGYVWCRDCQPSNFRVNSIIWSSLCIVLLLWYITLHFQLFLDIRKKEETKKLYKKDIFSKI